MHFKFQAVLGMFTYAISFTRLGLLMKLLKVRINLLVVTQIVNDRAAVRYRAV